MPLPFTTLDAVTSGTTGTSKDLESVLYNHTLIAQTTGEPTAAIVNLEGSHDNVNWTLLISGNAAAGDGVSVNIKAQAAIRYVRGELTTLSGGTSPTVTATIASA